jgi:hypothetical protein
MQFATIKGLRIEKYTLQSQNWRESAKTSHTCDLLPPAATSQFLNLGKHFFHGLESSFLKEM